MNIDMSELFELLKKERENPPIITTGSCEHPTIKTTPAPAITGQHIVVLDRGFVYVGNVTREGDFLRITDAKNIRYWGTKNGLGELQNGPLLETKLDPVGVVLAPMRALIHLVPCKGF